MSISCKKCGSNSYHKSGKMNGKQRYRCKECNFHYTLLDGRQKYSDTERLQAVLLYKKGLSLRSVGAFIGSSDVTVLNWVRSFGKRLKRSI